MAAGFNFAFVVVAVVVVVYAAVVQAKPAVLTPLANRNCVYGGKTYQPGDIIQTNDPCQFCICPSDGSGQMECSRAICMPPRCANPVKEKGNCCATCPVVPPTTSTSATTVPPPGGTCTFDGNVYQPGESWNSSDPCDTCFCPTDLSGVYECVTLMCMPPLCPNPIQVDGQCCLSCPDGWTPNVPCVYEGKTYEAGTSFQPDDPCLSCVCHADGSGEALCSSMSCIPLRCAEPITEEGKCCPTCPAGTCNYFGKDYQPGDSIPTNDPCTTCECPEDGSGFLLCRSMSCALPRCPNPVQEEGQCCPICPGDDTIIPVPSTTPEPTPPPPSPTPPTPTAMCEYEGEMYQPGERFQPNACTFCNCPEDGPYEVTCAVMDCPRPDCDNYVVVDFVCCPMCPDPPFTPESSTPPPPTPPPPPEPSTPRLPTLPPTQTPMCEYEGEMYQPGEHFQPDACTFCNCPEGGPYEVLCAVMDCARPMCDDYVFVDEECCPICPDPPFTEPTPPPPPPSSTPTALCEYEGELYQPGEHFQPDACTFCNCPEDGPYEVSCAVLACEEPMCDDVVFVDGECCPICLNPPFPTTTEPIPDSTCSHEGQVYQHGEEVETNNPCEYCTCDSGRVICAVMDCAPSPCNNPVRVEGQCCRVCPSVTCEHKGNFYEPGDEIETNNPCESCRCVDDGSIGCTLAPCLPLRCLNPVSVEGKCCPECPDSSCEYNGTVYQPGESFQPSPCDFCRCPIDGFGAPECIVMDCAAPPCSNPIHLEDQCCPVCHEILTTTPETTTSPNPPPPPPPEPSTPRPPTLPPTPTPMCEYEGKTYQPVDYIETGDPCVSCTCLETGLVRCRTMACALLLCPNPVSVEGKCCQECPTEPCYNETSYQPGKEVETDNPCLSCKCLEDGSGIGCNLVPCLKPMCPNPVTIDGQCCPVCPNNGTCDYNGKMYQPGETIETDDPCEFCKCPKEGTGVRICAYASCAYPECANPVREKGQCCPVCPPGSGTCKYNGNIYQPGENFQTDDPCETCFCPADGSGLVRCAIRDCARPPCDNAVKVEGKCCPVCPLGTCQYNDQFYQPGDKINTNDPCEFCECSDDNSGRVICAVVDCARPPCANPVRVEGKCCPVCPAGTCEYEGNFYEPGDKIETDDPCEFCECPSDGSGEVLCAVASCAPLVCANPVKEKGKCCPVCPGGYDTCEYNGIIYKPGTDIQTDNPCEVCYCPADGSGLISCAIKDCARPTCPYPVNVPGRCCPVCPVDFTTTTPTPTRTTHKKKECKTTTVAPTTKRIGGLN